MSIKEEGLSLGLSACKDGATNSIAKIQPDVMTLSTEVSSEDAKDDAMEAADQQWLPSKTQKNLRNVGTEPEDDIGPLPQAKKARVSVRARCDAPTVRRHNIPFERDVMLASYVVYIGVANDTRRSDN
jgi:hypothetical protein